jgi:hypothetical protein
LIDLVVSFGNSDQGLAARRLTASMICATRHLVWKSGQPIPGGCRRVRDRAHFAQDAVEHSTGVAISGQAAVRQEKTARPAFS